MDARVAKRWGKTRSRTLKDEFEFSRQSLQEEPSAALSSPVQVEVHMLQNLQWEILNGLFVFFDLKASQTLRHILKVEVKSEKEMYLA